MSCGCAPVHCGAFRPILHSRPRKRGRMDNLDDSTLLDGLRRGNEASYELMVRQYGGRMLAVARGLVRHDEDARDIVQSAFLSAFKGLRTFKGDCQLATWLHRIVVNAALMKLRTRRRKPEESIEPLLPTYLEDGHHAQDFADWAGQADRMLEQKEVRQTVRDAIASLPESHRVILMLRDIEEMTTEAVAAELGITANAVKIRLHRARQALGTVLRDTVARSARAHSPLARVCNPASGV
jgi:RNA polymerase sigma-70 factor, ECF subfamily